MLLSNIDVASILGSCNIRSKFCTSRAMGTGQGLLKRALEHVGEEYVNVRVPKDAGDWKGPWDCAEFMSWLVYQESGILYGCIDNKADPKTAEAYTGAWEKDSKTLGRRVSVEEAAATVGAFLLRYPPFPGKMGHIALSDGRGGTVEAKGKAFGVVADKVTGRRWDTGVLVPGINYDASQANIEVAAPRILYRLDTPNMIPGKIAEIQEALKQNGFDPGPVDGEFGAATARAVAAFQEKLGLVVDGEVGAGTADALGISLVGAALQTATTNEGGFGVTPLIPIAAALLPEIIKAIAGDKTGSVVESVTKAVTQATGTSNAVAAKQTIETNPATAAALQMKLAEIALEQEKQRQQAQAEILKAQIDRDIKAIQADLENTADARKAAAEYARSGGPMAWGAPLVSLIVTIGFFLILLVVMSIKTPFAEGVGQIVNITVGALAAAFATVVNFWLGSSQGSRNKDAAAVGIQLERAEQTKELIKTQAKTIEAVRQVTAAPSAEKPVAVGPSRSNFQACVDIVLEYEGGYSDHPSDPGGATNMGVTLQTLRRIRGDDGLTAEDVKKLSKEEACEIYRTTYWNVLRCDDLPRGVDLAVFDFGVNSGPARSAKFLQKIVGAEADGSIGPATVAATNAMEPKAIIEAMAERRMEFLRGLSTWPTFGNGWTKRVSGIRAAALRMAGAS